MTAALASLLLAWQVAAWFLPGFLLPGVPEVAGRVLRSLTQPDFLYGLRQSLFRLGAGYAAAFLLGSSAGLAAGLFHGFARCLRSLVSVLQAIPPVTWMPFLIILFGFGDRPIVTVVALASFFPMALSVLGGIEGVNPLHVEQARVLGASRWQLLAKVYAPEALPAVLTGAQVAFGNAWRSLIAGEMVGGVGAGLGWSISYAGEVADMGGVLAGIVVIGGLAILLDHAVLEQFKRRLLPWRYLSERNGA